MFLICCSQFRASSVSRCSLEKPCWNLESTKNDMAEWKVIENGFRLKWNFLKCYGAIDGKHVTIHAPANCGKNRLYLKR
jgi:hypothetical protein